MVVLGDSAAIQMLVVAMRRNALHSKEVNATEVIHVDFLMVMILLVILAAAVNQKLVLFAMHSKEVNVSEVIHVDSLILVVMYLIHILEGEVSLENVLLINVVSAIGETLASFHMMLKPAQGFSVYICKQYFLINWVDGE